MIRTTLWHPDTCSCKIEISWDDQLSEENSQPTLQAIQKCDVHSSLSDQDAYEAATGRNVLKNQVLGVVHQAHPELTETSKDGVISLKEGVEYKFSYDENQKLQASFTGIDDAKALEIQASIDSSLGSGKADVLKLESINVEEVEL